MTWNPRILGGIVLLSSALIVSACSSGSSSSASSASAGGASSSSACPDGVTKLSVLRGQSDSPTDDELARYKATDPCVTFTVTEVPFNQYLAKLPIALSSSNPPDIYDVDSPTVAAYTDKGTLLPLDKYLPSDYKTDLDSADLKETTVNGQIYSMPLQQVGLALFYNKTLTKKAGITVPSSLDTAWTWAQAKAAMLKCQTTAGGSVQGLASGLFAASLANNSYRDLGIIRSAGDPTADPTSSSYKTFAGISSDGKSVDGYLNSPEAIQAATFYQGLFNGKDKVSSPTIVQNSFVNGNACFDITVAGVVGPFSKLKFPAGVSPVPYFKHPIIHMGTIDVGVSPKSKHTAEAAKVIVAMGTGSLAYSNAEAAQSISPLKSVIAKSAWLKTEPNALIVQELLNWAQPRPINTHYDQFDLYVGTALHDIMDGSDPKKSLDQAVSRIDPILSS